MVLTGDAITGMGAWAVVTNSCGLPLPSSGQTFLISGTRLDADAGGLCAAPASTLLQKFLRNPLTMLPGVTP
jgi:hypothetical protein